VREVAAAAHHAPQRGRSADDGDDLVPRRQSTGLHELQPHLFAGGFSEQLVVSSQELAGDGDFGGEQFRGRPSSSTRSGYFSDLLLPSKLRLVCE
jgi:hypothetical protein